MNINNTIRRQHPAEMVTVLVIDASFKLSEKIRCSPLNRKLEDLKILFQLPRISKEYQQHGMRLNPSCWKIKATPSQRNTG